MRLTRRGIGIGYATAWPTKTSAKAAKRMFREKENMLEYPRDKLVNERKLAVSESGER